MAHTSGSVSITATVTVIGTSENILTYAQGLTLYYLTTDARHQEFVAVDGWCEAPLVMSGSSIPASTTSLPGKLTIVTDANGNRVAYNGHPLSTYSGDTGPGQTSGEGVGGVWYVVTHSLT